MAEKVDKKVLQAQIDAIKDGEVLKYKCLE